MHFVCLFTLFWIIFRAPRVAFGTCQKRLMFPTHFASDRMGNELHAQRDSAELGPGCYDNHNVRLSKCLDHIIYQFSFFVKFAVQWNVKGT